ncbi:PEX11C [Acanthosepion pharaonis]|uniref:PEX11C n=1 Tax=Acanthosepion pharaonis TaxID=158019 RepID=A0A812BCR9_ACAPH|nr:PEX11C [Sepia pharaonis]
MEDIVNLLETYRGRDKVIRLCCYGAMLLAGKDGKNSRLLRVSAALSDCRVVLRLFDDIPIKKKVAWLADTRVLSVHSSPWWTRATYIWLFSLIAEILQVLMKLKKLHETRTLFLQQPNNQSGLPETQIKLQRLSQENTFHLLTVLQNFTDLICAVHWLPPGRLWSGKLSHVTVGLLGSISSMIRLYHVYLQNSKKSMKTSK